VPPGLTLPARQGSGRRSRGLSQDRRAGLSRHIQGGASPAGESANHRLGSDLHDLRAFRETFGVEKTCRHNKKEHGLLHLPKGANAQQSYLQYKLNNAYVSPIQVGGSSGDRPTESLNLNFTQVQPAYSTQDYPASTCSGTRL
jgi:hypothetical protein